jgi:hypothetical protein
MIKEIYDPDLDVTCVTEDVPSGGLIVYGWYNGEPNAEATKELIERMMQNEH